MHHLRNSSCHFVGRGGPVKRNKVWEGKPMAKHTNINVCYAFSLQLAWLRGMSDLSGECKAQTPKGIPASTTLDNLTYGELFGNNKRAQTMRANARPRPPYVEKHMNS